MFKILSKNKKKKSNSIDSTIDMMPGNIHTKEAYKHSINYSKLLDLYIKSTKQTIYLKLSFKILFFIATIGSLIAVSFALVKSVNYVFNFFNKFENICDIKIEAILSILTIIVPVFSSFIVAFLKIPEIIAKYLFNIEEERYMDSIIKNIQDFDIANQQRIMDFLLEDKKRAIKEKDDTLEDLDNIKEKSKKENIVESK